MRPTRRGFLQGAFASVLAPALLPTQGDQHKALVLVQLTGGNDGLNTVIPWSSPVYYKKRPNLAIEEAAVLKLDDSVGLHPNLKQLEGLFQAGGLAVIQGAGYPGPIRSHFRSLDVWHTGRRKGRLSGRGWVSRACDEAYPNESNSERVVHVGARVPYSLRSANRPPVTLSSRNRYRLVANASSKVVLRKQSVMQSVETGLRAERVARLRSVMRDADRSSERIMNALSSYEPSVNYPSGTFADSLGVIAATLSAGLGARVLSVELEGFDTHGGQRRRHDPLLRVLDRGLGAFHRDLAARGLLDEVVILVFSEFGRRVKENASQGTDHGTAGPMFVLGGGVRGGLHGQAPALTDLEEFDLEFTTDFRSVYSSVIERCFNVTGMSVLGARYPELGLFKPR